MNEDKKEELRQILTGLQDDVRGKFGDSVHVYIISSFYEIGRGDRLGLVKINWSAWGATKIEETKEFQRQLNAAVDYAEQLQQEIDELIKEFGE